MFPPLFQLISLRISLTLLEANKFYSKGNLGQSRSGAYPGGAGSPKGPKKKKEKGREEEREKKKRGRKEKKGGDKKEKR